MGWDNGRLGIYVNATSPISVYSINYRPQTAGMNVVFPTKTMGKEYMMATYDPSFGAFFVVAAVEDNTTVQVQFQLAGNGQCLDSAFTDGGIATVTLNRHQTWGGKCNTSFVGSMVTSDKAVSVTVGLKCDAVPIHVTFCDYMSETMIPLEDLGTTYILHDIKYRTSGTIYRVISPYDDNNIDASGTVTLQKGEFRDYEIDDGTLLGLLGSEMCITSTKPVMVLMFTQGGGSDTAVPMGDPSMSLVAPVQKFTNDYVVDLEINPSESMDRRVAITVATSERDNMVLPGNANFGSVGCGYSVGHVSLAAGPHWLRHSTGAPFGALLYASGTQYGFATIAGMSLIDKFDIDDCVPEPCQNGASCIDGVNEYNCSCVAGYTGLLCETEIDECSPNPCQNGGSCFDEINGYNCTCAVGFNGSDCETNIDDCSPNPCQNGATCTDGINGYNCTCAPDFTGKNCTKQIPQTTQLSTTLTTEETAATTTEETTQDTTTQDTATQDTTTEDTATEDRTLEDTSTQGAASSQTEETTPDTTTEDTSIEDTTTKDTTIEDTSSQGAASSQTTATIPSSPQTTRSQAGAANTTLSVEIATVSPAPKIGKCPCNCQAVNLQNKTQEELIEKAEENAEHLKEELTVDKSGLSSTKRKVTSAPDYRPSAQGIGYVGLTFLVLSFGSILLLDLTSLCRAAEKKVVKDPKKES
ncbi:uncharacterized protein [Littorina saxatilis]|uniref:uncharacterized protein n=1 Tax=Littorina saxatilis TaxID=31220 RepID=UPI0038B5C708